MKNLSTRRDVSVRIAERVAQSVGPRKYSMWFDRTCRFDVDETDRRLDVRVPSRFVADWIGKHFDADLRSAAKHELGDGVNVRLTVHPELFGANGSVGNGSVGNGSVVNGSVMDPDMVSDAAGAESGETTLAHGARFDRGDSRNPGRRPTGESAVIPTFVPSGSRHGAPVSSTVHPRSVLQLRHKLDDFIVGPGNELAYAAAHRLVADDQSPTHPLFIHGGCGMGKTHLLQGICRKMQESRPDARILYTTGEQFTNDFLTGVRANRLEEFRRRIRNLDLLVVDDVHFIANKEKTQQEFLHSFDAIELGGARVVLASDCHPKMIQLFSDALVSRCIRGMVVEIRQPDTATRIRIIKALAERRGMPLMDSVVEMLASRCRGSIRELEGTLTKLHALASLNALRPRPEASLSDSTNGSGRGNGNITGNGSTNGTGISNVSGNGSGSSIGHALLNKLFETEGQNPTNRAVSSEHILEAVAERMNITRSVMLGNSKQAHAVLSRSIYVYLARQLTTMSYPEIASALSKKNHSTVITAAKRIEKQIAAKQSVTLPSSLETLAIHELVEQIKHSARRGV